jgi:hypothetical protein
VAEAAAGSAESLSADRNPARARIPIATSKTLFAAVHSQRPAVAQIGIRFGADSDRESHRRSKLVLRRTGHDGHASKSHLVPHLRTWHAEPHELERLIGT